MEVWVQESGHSSLRSLCFPGGDLFTPCRPSPAQGEMATQEGHGQGQECL